MVERLMTNDEIGKAYEIHERRTEGRAGGRVGENSGAGAVEG